MNHPNVLVVIVTFNRVDILKECINNLLPQKAFGLGEIFVVVNGKDAETIEYLRDFSSDISLRYRMYDNIGPAGGFHEGLSYFLSSSFEYVWLMDDDIIVGKDALKYLLEQGYSYVYPKVFTPSKKEIISYGWWGVLMDKKLVQKVGLPVKELFYWAEDTEFLQDRIERKFKIKAKRSQEAVVVHLHKRNKLKPSWYYYYAIRNTLYYRTHIAGYTQYRLKRTFYLLISSFFRILFIEKRKVLKIYLYLLGVFHFFIKKIGKTIDPLKYN